VLIILGFHRFIEHFLDTDDITIKFSDKYQTLQTYFTNSSLELSDKRPEESADSLTCLHKYCILNVCTVELGVLRSQVYRLVEIKDQ